jgi:hypothetical protein
VRPCSTGTWPFCRGPSGPAAALPYVDLLVGTQTLARYHLLHSVRGDLLERLGRPDEAAAEFDRAVALATNEGERLLLEKRAAACRDRVSPPERLRAGTAPRGSLRCSARGPSGARRNEVSM